MLLVLLFWKDLGFFAAVETVEFLFLTRLQAINLGPTFGVSRVGTRIYSIWEAELEANQYVAYTQEASRDRGVASTRIIKLYLAMPWIRLGTGYGYRTLSTHLNDINAVSNTVVQSFQAGYHFHDQKFFFGGDLDIYRPIGQKKFGVSSRSMYLTESEKEGVKRDLYKPSAMLGITVGYMI